MKITTSIKLGPYNDKNQRHGLWEIYNDFNLLWWKGNYINDDPAGFHIVYNKNSSLDSLKSNLIEKFYYII